VTRYRSGIPERHFEADGRNEALDCRVYAMAAIEIIRPNYRKIARGLAGKPGEKPATTEEPQPPDSPAQTIVPQPQPATHKPPVRRIFPRRPSGWMA
jgi:phage terminase large subunit GpA-like protein